MCAALESADIKRLEIIGFRGGAKSTRSRGQKNARLKTPPARPSLGIADDVEDLDWVRTQENRDKSDRWMR